MTFLAGERVRASELNSLGAIVARCTADKTYTSSATLADVTGMSASLEASSSYIFWGYISYVALSTTPDIKVAFTPPSGATGHWSLGSLSSASSTPGSYDAQASTSFTTAQTGGTDASVGIAARPAGFITTTNAGTMQVQAAQNTSSGTTLTVRSGSWIVFRKVA